MKENEIIKALECCSIRNTNCKECPYYLEKDCVEKDALDLIQKKNTEIDILIRKNETLKDEVSRLQNILVGFMSEVEMWSNKYDVDISNIHRIPLLAKEDFNIRNKIKMKGIKEFWHKLKQKKKWDIDMPDHIYVSDGDNLLKELTE